MWVEKVLMWIFQALAGFYMFGIAFSIVYELWGDFQQCREDEREHRKQVELVEIEQRRRQQEHFERLRQSHDSDRRWPEDGPDQEW